MRYDCITYLLIKIKGVVEISLMIGVITLRFDFVNEEEQVRELSCTILLIVWILVEKSVPKDSRVGSVKLLWTLDLIQD